MPVAVKRNEALEEPDLEQFATTGQIAEKYGVTQQEVQKAIKRGVINAQRVGYFYLIWMPGLPSAWPE